VPAVHDDAPPVRPARWASPLPRAPALAGRPPGCTLHCKNIYDPLSSNNFPHCYDKEWADYFKRFPSIGKDVRP
jgi:hypothetical protein